LPVAAVVAALTLVLAVVEAVLAGAVVLVVLEHYLRNL
jgi:hypothetical protein|tara:strand:+ start:214 stop:327 length:114 start_codon:yes stop_codon:yes gene_type:complete